MIACRNAEFKYSMSGDRSLKKKCDVYDGLRLRISELGVSSSEHQ
ncbi:hypothetical protein [Nostoc sp. LEGE 12447]|nr:hypothetical protein [Nostoc sp. LEGE 12447]